MSKKSGGCKVVVMLFVGILLGILITIGVLAGTGYWAYNNMSITKLEQLLGTKLINVGEYNNKPIKDLISELDNTTSMTISELDDKFLEGNIKKNLILEINGNQIDLTKNVFSGIMTAKISTVTDELGKIKDHLTFGVVYNDILIGGGLDLPKNSPFALKFKNISLEDTLSNYKTEKIATLFEEEHDFGNKIIQTVYNAFKDNDMTFEDLNSDDKTKLNEALDSMPVNNLLDLDGSEDGLLGELASHNFTLGDLKDNNSYDELLINNILSITKESDGVLGAIAEKNWTINDLKNSSNFNTLKLGKILNITTSTTGILKAMENWTLGELNDDKIKTLTLGTALGLNDTTTGILSVMKDWKLNEINETKINTLKLGEIITITASSTKMLQTLQNTTIGNLSNDIDNLRLEDVMDLGSKNYKTNSSLTDYDSYTGFIGLLYETDTHSKGPLIKELSSKLNTINVDMLTLGELQSRELINTSADLTKSLNSKPLKDYTLQELINYVASIAS